VTNGASSGQGLSSQGDPGIRVVILAGGLGTRLAEETHDKPKALVEIGGMPILWHLMQHYLHYGFRDFVIALGYKGEMISSFFRELRREGDPRQRQLPGLASAANHAHLDWQVELVDTGYGTAKGGRLRQLAPYLSGGTFMLTWCDGLSDVNLRDLVAFHRAHGKLATVTAVHPPPRFGVLELDGPRVLRFWEKPPDNHTWVNGAFFVLEPAALNYIQDDDSGWEEGPLPRLALDGQLMAFRHTSFWQCMDTVHERDLLETLWSSGQAPWRTWE